MEPNYHYIDMDDNRLTRLRQLASDARAAIDGLADDAPVAPEALPADITALWDLKEPLSAAECRNRLDTVMVKTGLALSVRDLRKGATFNQTATRLLFDKPKPEPGSLQSFFGRRG